MNRAVAERCARDGVHLLYRNHRGNPVADRGALQADLAIAAGGGTHASAAVARMQMMLGRAELSPKATGHFSLNLPAYAWVTSPLRRYADLVNHRLLRARLLGEAPPHGEAELATMAEGLNRIAREVVETRNAAEEAARLRRGERALRGQRFDTLDDATFHQAVKAAALCGEMPAALADECHEMAQAGQISGLDWREGVRGTAFTCVASATADGRRVSTDAVPASGKKAAQHGAAVALVALLVGVHHAPAAEAPAAPLPGATARAPDPAAQGSAASDPNAKGALLTLCQRRGWPMPGFEVAASGPPHAPTFLTTAAVVAEGREVTSSPQQAASRRDGERLAAAALLVALEGAAEPGAAQAAVIGRAGDGNWKGALQEICQARNWPVPVYEVVQSGPLHAPKFRATVAIRSSGGATRRASGEAASR